MARAADRGDGDDGDGQGARMGERELWEASGGLALTGRPDGRPLHGPGRPATAVRRGLDRILALHPDAALPGVEVVGERAALSGLKRNGPWSCSGSFRVLRTLDGWLGMSLPRASDAAHVVTLTGIASEDPWSTIADWASVTPTWVATNRLSSLEVAAAPVPAPRTPRPGVVVDTLGTRHRADGERPLVVDLSARWAGGLCARLVGLTGARVVRVDHPGAIDPDPAGTPAFDQVLRGASEHVDLDPTSDVATLAGLLKRADLVVACAGNRELRRLGLSAERVVRGGTSWVTITPRGRDSTAVGFGDDIAAAAGHVLHDGPDLLPVGDALAEPLAGVAAAAAAVEALAGTEARLVDVSMLHVAAEAL